jgi:Tol biopolymer transport system component
MRLLKKVVIIIMFLLIAPWVVYFVLSYRGLVFSSFAKNQLRGKIIYALTSIPSIDIRSIDFPSGKKRIVYISPLKGEDGYLSYVNSLSFSIDGRKLIFSKMGEESEGYRFKLCTMNIDGTDVRDLLELENMDAKHPSWSLDGKKFAFTVKKAHGQGGLYVSNTDKPYSSLKRICNIRPSTMRLSWSPDGENVSFVSDEHISKEIKPGWRYEIFSGRAFIINADGSRLRRLEVDDTVSWSPDGKLLLYRGKDGYYVSNEDQTQTYLVIPYKRPPLSIFVGDPSFAVWSPDGRYIAYVKEIWPGMVTGLGIFVVPLDSPGHEIQVSVENHEVTEMVWVK